MKIVLILSGGMDSVTLLHKFLDEGSEVVTLSFDYGQKHAKELQSAKYWSDLLGVRHDTINMQGIFSGSALTGDVLMPMTDYSVESMKQTVVPNRNMVMLAIATSKAIQIGADAVAYAAHAGDHEVYPDCRPAFVNALSAAIVRCDWSYVQLLVPFLEWTKKDIAAEARRLGVDLGKTWSCYEGGDTPCGRCGACRSREEALA